MSNICSIFEASDGSIINLSDVYYINTKFRYVELRGTRILFTKVDSLDEDDIERLVIAYRNYHSILDENKSLKINAENICNAPRIITKQMESAIKHFASIENNG